MNFEKASPIWAKVYTLYFLKNIKPILGIIYMGFAK
jgi:hypothetical protein